ncbi:hypothetical protein GWI33_008810, partial [Rhynchophorus ferrugineus]
LVEDGVLQTVVDKVFPPRDIELALQHIQSPYSIGIQIKSRYRLVSTLLYLEMCIKFFFNIFTRKFGM